MSHISALRNKNIAKFLETSSQYFNLPGLFRSLLLAGSIGTSLGSAAIASEDFDAEPTTKTCADRASRSEVAGPAAPTKSLSGVSTP